MPPLLTVRILGIEDGLRPLDLKIEPCEEKSFLMNLKALKSLVVNFLGLVLAFYCLASPVAASEELLRQPKERVFGDWRVTQLSAEPSTLNPITATDAYAGDVNGYIYESLLKRDEKSLQIVPVLADKWEISPDHLKYTFHLKKNIKWSDGSPFTAKDILFSFDRIRDPKVDSGPCAIIIRTLKKLRRQTIIRSVFVTGPLFPTLEVCGSIPIVPVHLFKEGEDFNQHPIGRIGRNRSVQAAALGDGKRDCFGSQ